MAIKKYKLDIGEISKDFSVSIIKFSTKLKSQRVEYSIIKQLIRSGTSIGANIREAKSSSSLKEYIRFLEIALRSANETDYWLEIIDEIYKNKEDSNVLIMELTQIRKILGSIIVKLKQKNVIVNSQ